MRQVEDSLQRLATHRIDILLIHQIERVCARYNVPLAAAAIQFPLGHPAISSIISGAVKPGEVKQNISLMGIDIPSSLWEELKQEGLLHQKAPTP